MTETAINTKGGGSTIAICTVIPNDSESQMKFEYIFNSYAKQMIYVANRILGNRQDAEDATQEALLRIAANIKSVDTTDESRAKSYVLTAAKNAAKDILKARSARAKTVDIESAYEIYEEDSSLGVIENAGYEEILDCIRELDPIYRDVLYYHLAEEMSGKEIASLLGRKYGTVKMQIKRGKAILAKSLENRR